MIKDRRWKLAVLVMISDDFNFEKWNYLWWYDYNDDDDDDDNDDIENSKMMIMKMFYLLWY